MTRRIRIPTKCPLRVIVTVCSALTALVLLATMPLAPAAFAQGNPAAAPPPPETAPPPVSPAAPT
ncbi:MAG: hypothetical protein WBE99_23775, partial [Xanthobacteraceae bacterium]